MANKPIILSDNLLDDAVLHPSHVVSLNAVTEVEGQELFRVADNLRDVTSFTIQQVAADCLVNVDCGVPVAPDTLIYDRGHNWLGHPSSVSYSDDGAGWTDIVGWNLPTVAGGLPAGASGVLTPDGVWWARWTPQAHRYWRVWFAPVGGVSPRITGLYLGQSYRLPEYLDAPGAYDYRRNHKVLKNEVSQGGVRVKRRILNFSEIDLALRLEAEDYEQFHPHVARLMDYNQPWWFCLDDSTETGAGMMRLYQLPGDTVYDPVVNPVHREVRLLLEEVIPALTI